MLLERIVIPYKLTLLVKLQPVFDGIAIERFCTVAKSIGDTCSRVVIACFQSRLQCLIILCNIRTYICFRCICKINASLTGRNSCIQYLICLFDIKLATFRLRNDHKLSILKCHICILRCGLILCLCTVQWFELFLKPGLVVSCILGNSIALLLIHAFDPFIRLLLFQKIQHFSGRKILIINLISCNCLRIQSSRRNLNGIILEFLFEQILYFICRHTWTVHTIDPCSLKKPIREVVACSCIGTATNHKHHQKQKPKDTPTFVFLFASFLFLYRLFIHIIYRNIHDRSGTCRFMSCRMRSLLIHFFGLIIRFCIFYGFFVILSKFFTIIGILLIRLCIFIFFSWIIILAQIIQPFIVVRWVCQSVHNRINMFFHICALTRCPFTVR